MNMKKTIKTTATKKPSLRPTKKPLAAAAEKIASKTKPTSDKVFDLMDFCKPAEIHEEIIEHDGRKLLFRIREFMSSDREGLVEYLDKVSELHSDFLRMKADYEKLVEQCEKDNLKPPPFTGNKSIVKERFWMQKYKAKMAFQLLVDKNGAPMFQSFELMRTHMKPELLDLVGDAVHEVVNNGGVALAEKP